MYFVCRDYFSSSLIVGAGLNFFFLGARTRFLNRSGTVLNSCKTIFIHSFIKSGLCSVRIWTISGEPLFPSKTETRTPFRFLTQSAHKCWQHISCWNHMCSLSPPSLLNRCHFNCSAIEKYNPPVNDDRVLENLDNG